MENILRVEFTLRNKNRFIYIFFNSIFRKGFQSLNYYWHNFYSKRDRKIENKVKITLNYLFQSSIKNLKEIMVSLINNLYLNEYSGVLKGFLTENTYSSNLNAQAANLVLKNDILKGRKFVYKRFKSFLMNTKFITEKVLC